MTRHVRSAAVPLAAALLAAGCASTAPPSAALPAAYTLEVRFERTGGETVVAPRILAYAGQNATVQVLRQDSYVRSFHRDRGGEGAVVEPVVGTVQGGILLAARTVPLADGSGARFEYRLTVMDPCKPFGERKVPLTAGTEFTIQMPEVRKIEVEGATSLPDGEERAVAVLPWTGEGGGEITVRVRIRGAGVPADMEPSGADHLGLEPSADDARDGESDTAEPRRAQARASLATPAAAGSPGWFRLRSVRLTRAMEQGTILDGAPLRALREAGSVAVEQDLQWAGTAGEVPHALATLERPFLTDYDAETEMADTWISGAVLQSLSAGLLAAPDTSGNLRCTSSSFPPLETFVTSAFSGPPVTIDLPELRVHAGTVGAGPGERLLVLGPREDGGSHGVLLSFRPGATGPER